MDVYPQGVTDDDLRAEFRTIGQRLDAMQAHIDERFNGVDERFNGVYEVLTAQGNAIARLDAKVDQLLIPKPRRVEAGSPYPEARTAKGDQR